MTKDLYATLGVSKTATKEEIKKSYRKLARKWHPDINPGNKDAEQKFKEISAAYDCLGDEQKRKLYDEFGEEGLQAGFDAKKARQYQEWTSTGPNEWQGAQEDFGRYHLSYEDIFGDLFSTGTSGEFRSERPRKGRNLEYDMTIDLISALKGFETEISMQKQTACPHCNGSGQDPTVAPTTCPTCGGTGQGKRGQRSHAVYQNLFQVPRKRHIRRVLCSVRGIRPRQWCGKNQGQYPQGRT